MKLTLLLLLALSASPLAAEKWQKLYSNELAVEYVDLETIVRVENKATASFRRDYTDGVARWAEDEAGNSFRFVRSHSVQTFLCDSNEHSIDQLWFLAADGKTRSPTKSYPLDKNNDTWDAAARKAVCR